MSINK